MDENESVQAISAGTGLAGMHDACESASMA